MMLPDIPNEFLLGALVQSRDVMIWALWSVIPIFLFLRGRRKAGVVTGVIVLFMIAVYLPSSRGAKERAQRAACLQNQQEIAQAIDQVAKANGAKPSEIITAKEVSAKLSGGEMPTCPAGGELYGLKSRDTTSLQRGEP